MIQLFNPCLADVHSNSRDEDLDFFYDIMHLYCLTSTALCTAPKYQNPGSIPDAINVQELLKNPLFRFIIVNLFCLLNGQKRRLLKVGSYLMAFTLHLCISHGNGNH